jgi:hypothetical protein
MLPQIQKGFLKMTRIHKNKGLDYLLDLLRLALLLMGSNPSARRF